MQHSVRRPLPEESPQYYKTYIDKVPQEDFLSFLKTSSSEITAFLKGLSEEQWMHRYAPDKWSIKEMMLHIVDTERIMAYRALRISRGDKTPLPGFEQDDYVPFSKADQRSSASIISEYDAVRQASVQLFEYLDDSHLKTVGVASGNPFTPRALGFVLAGHEVHHMQVLKERYL
ncbi:MAG: putative damage-inducible protein DinB [Polaribacter sp.]|jgi:uncharacterized damage-inducible protein DinB